eukprot:7382136-Prymnesium_polylepis.1
MASSRGTSAWPGCRRSRPRRCRAPARRPPTATCPAASKVDDRRAVRMQRDAVRGRLERRTVGDAVDGEAVRRVGLRRVVGEAPAPQRRPIEDDDGAGAGVRDEGDLAVNVDGDVVEEGRVGRRRLLGEDVTLPERAGVVQVEDDDLRRASVDGGGRGEDVAPADVDDPHLSAHRIDLHGLDVLQGDAVASFLRLPRRKQRQRPIGRQLCQRCRHPRAPARDRQKRLVAEDLDARAGRGGLGV